DNTNKLRINKVNYRINVINNRTKIIIGLQGSIGFIDCLIMTLAILAPTNNIVPTGGVILPIHIENTIIIPKCTTSIPKLWTIGKNIGVKIKTAGATSIKVPTNIRIDRIIKIMIILLSVILNIEFVIAAGIPATVKI